MSCVVDSFFITLILALLLSACSGGGGGSDTAVKSETLLKGTFVDSPVENLNYRTSSQTGSTDSAGQFTYKEGETITFSIGGIDLPSVVAKLYVTPLDLVGANIDNLSVINISRLLQSLDLDGDSSNGIEIGDEAHVSAQSINDVDFSDLNFDSLVINLVANSGSTTTILVSATIAIDHLQLTLDNFDNDLDGFTVTEGDCNENNAALHPNTVWYRDVDGDGHSDGSQLIQCSQPENYDLEENLVDISDDFDDTDATRYPGAPEICGDGIDQNGDDIDLSCDAPRVDEDGDGFTVSEGDCNDNNAALHPNTIWYKDADGDGYSDGSQLAQCVQPTNYELAENLTTTTGDLDDTDASIFPGALETATKPLNDTGVTWAGNDSDELSSICAGVGSDQQDCSAGRDVLNADDSDGQAGFSFTKLDSDGQELVASATSWSCVRDNTTGLVWENKSDDEGIHDKDNHYTWGGKTDVSNGIGGVFESWDILINDSNDEALCGFSDWRVPDLYELESIVHYGNQFFAIDNEYFPNQTGFRFWSSQAFWHLGDAYTIEFNTGATSYNLAADVDRHINAVRLVRGGTVQSIELSNCSSELPATTPNSRLVNNDNGTITDMATGLMWKQCVEGDHSTLNNDCISTENDKLVSKVSSWDEALQVPAIINNSGGYAGFTDWRLPNVKELLSIVEYACTGDTSGAMNWDKFILGTGQGTGLIWSSTPYQHFDFNDNLTKSAWVVNFGRFGGSSTIFALTNSTSVRLVRDIQ